MRTVEFVEGEYYHIFNRGVDKRDIFHDDFDRSRFATSLYYLNDDSGRPARIDRKMGIGKSRALTDDTLFPERPGEKLVSILCWALMPNHFHILAQEVKHHGISSFMHRLETSHSLYFNVKYKRTGALFGRRFKAVHVSNDQQFTHASRYIHINSLELFEHDWKERGQVQNLDGALHFLKEYRWSSLPAYLTQSASPDQIIDNTSIMDQFDNSHEDYWKFIKEWLEPGSDHDYNYENYE